MIVDQRGQQFIPALVVAQVGQPVEFRNGESIPHNVYVARAGSGAAEFNVSTDPNQAHTHTFTRSGRTRSPATFTPACGRPLSS